MEDNPHASAGVREGDVLAGKYRIDKILGVGGMGVVVAAHHIQLDDRVAIKFLLPQALANRETVARFAREARAAVKIKSEHVARVSDVGTLDNGAPYMVMEYLEGTDLQVWVQQKGPLSVEQAVEFLLQACEALAEAHVLGIVHRDLKPANLFVTKRPDGAFLVKVLDFGISKTTGGSLSGADLTHTAAVMGSPLYMSPEQMQASKNADARSDIWAIGVILYELVTGELPFAAETMAELVTKILSMPPAPLLTTRPHLPQKLEEVVTKCLEKDRGKRYATVGQLAMALLEFAPKRAKISVERINGIMKAAGLSDTALAMPVSSGEIVEPLAAAGTAASWATTGKAAAGRVAALRIGGLASVLLVAIGVATVWRSRDARPPAEPAASVASGELHVPLQAEPSTAIPAAAPTNVPVPSAVAIQPEVVPPPSASAVLPPEATEGVAPGSVTKGKPARSSTHPKASASKPPPAALPMPAPTFAPAPSPAAPPEVHHTSPKPSDSDPFARLTPK